MPNRPPTRVLRKPTLYTFGEPELVDLDDRTARILRIGLVCGTASSIPSARRGNDRCLARSNRIVLLKHDSWSQDALIGL